MSLASNAKQIGKDFVNSAIGHTDKACLVVHDMRSKCQNLEPDLGAGSGLAGGLSKVAEQTAKTREVLNAGVSAVSGAAASEDKILFVQFNPSSLQIHSSNQHDDRRNLSAGNEEQFGQNDAVMVPVVDLTLSLVFDQMNVYDSFMADKVQGANVSTVTNAISGMVKDFSVQPYVEGFISAIRNYYTRCITFQWADFSFTGMLANMNAVYTMFSVSGHPVRAQVQLLLRQDLRKTELQKWNKDFQKMIGAVNDMIGQEQGQISSDFDSLVGDQASLTSPSQYVSNLLNLGI